jgi:ATP-GRASP peptide maturase of grasp-with-spasm system
MILILSEKEDFSTTQIIEWLNYIKKKWIRINKDDLIEVKCIGNDLSFKIDDEVKFHLSEIKSVWYRRGALNFKRDLTNIKEIDDYINQEFTTLKQYIYYRLSKIHHLDTINNSYVNKLVVNSIADEIGIKTPRSFIFSEKENLFKKINNSKKNYITKSMYGDPLIDLGNISIKNYTSKVELDSIITLSFVPSLVQQYIEKKYELRIYYFKGEFFSMAIFSQNDSQTMTDFRKYNDEKPNRRVPFKLPLEISKKINTLMIKLGYETGSIDMIVTPNNEYIFLEVNPVGQFSMTSFPCNYNIEKKIAKYL